MNQAILSLAFVAVTLSAVADSATTEPKVGDTLASGNLVLYVFHQAKSQKPIPAELATDYGFMVLNLGSEEKPKPLYRLASRATSTVQDFETLPAFVTALSKLPKRSVLHHYDKCLVPTSYGIDFDFNKFAATCKQLDIKLDDNAKLTCNCPD
jgi:hypothetical protein